MDHHSSKHKELSEQLATWWRTQTDFKTKRALAGFLNVHPDTLGDYFSGSKFPRSDIANRLCELTKIICLKPHTGGDSSSEMVPQESPTVLLLPPPGDDTPMEKAQTDTRGSEVPLKEEDRLGESAEVTARQPPEELLKKGERHGERAVVISLQRTSCPLCAHDIARFRSCVYCGQHFVWANVPIEHDERL